MSEKNVNKVDRIRDLIFGNQLKDVESQFNEINDTLKIIEENMTKSFNDSYTKLQKETEHSLALLENKIDSLSFSSAKERIKLKELMDTADESFQKQLMNQKDEFTANMKIMKENITEDNKKVSENMTAMQHEIEAMLEKNLNSLADEKLSRDSMAQMLLDLAMKIQGTDVNTVPAQGIKTEK